MPPPSGYDPIGTVQQAIASLLNTNEPLFIAMGARLFTSFAVILLAWYGIRWMLGAGDAGERVFGFARLLMVIAFGYAMITFYESPIPGFDSSFSNLITDQTGYLASTISAQSVQNAQQTLNTLWNALEQPDPWSLLANLLYFSNAAAGGVVVRRGLEDDRLLCADIPRTNGHGEIDGRLPDVETQVNARIYRYVNRRSDGVRRSGNAAGRNVIGGRSVATVVAD